MNIFDETFGIKNKNEEPFENTNLGIFLNTLSGIPQASVDLGKNILRAVPRAVATVGTTAGNVPTQIVNALDKLDRQLPFAEEIPTTESAITRALFGKEPIKTVQKRTEDLKSFLKPYIGETGSSYTALPLVLGSIAIDLSGWGGGKGVKSFATGEIPESFFEFVAKEQSPEILEKTLKEIGLDPLRSASLAKQLAPTKTIDEAKSVLATFEDEVKAFKELSGGVDTAESALSKEALKYKSAEEFVNSRKIVYHGTTEKNAKLIEQDGFRPGKEEISNISSRNVGGSFTTDKNTAQEFAYHRAKQNGDKPSVIQIDITDIKNPEITKYGNGDEIYVPVDELNKIKTKSQLIDIWNKTQQPLSIERPDVLLVDKLIADGKIRVVSRNGKDIYQVQKGGNWVNTRDESSAIKQVKKTIKPELPPEIQQKQIELEIRKDAIENNQARELSKFVSKSGDFKGGLREVTGKGKSTFEQKGDQYAMDAGFEDAEAARVGYEEYKKEKEYVAFLEKSLKEDIKAFKNNPTASDFPKIEQPTQIPQEEVASIERQVEQSLSKIPDPEIDRVLPLRDIVIDKSTPVNEKVGIIDYFRTPDRILKKIGLDEASKSLRESYDGYVRELPAQLSLVTDWARRIHTKDGNQRIFKWLDGQSNQITGEELKVANEIKEYLKEWADRLNLPDDNKITHYITHIFDIGEKQKEFDEDIAALIKNKVPGSVYDPFLEKRLGAKGYVEDTWRALDAYIKRAVRKANMDPALEILKRDSKGLEESQLNYVTRLGARINMRPTEWDNLLDNTIKQLVGYRFGQRPTALISSTLRKAVYRGTLGLNINSAVKNLTQGANTFAKLGARDTLAGYIHLLNPESSKQLEESGILKGTFIQDRTISALKQKIQTIDKGLFVMFELAEKINRGSAYFGAFNKALRQGKSEIEAMEYAKKLVRDTQFTFGSIDTPVAMQGDIAKTLFQFGSFSQKQTDFLSEMIKNKEYAGIIRYILASLAIVYTAGQVFDIKGKDFNPLNYFSRFGKPPSLALPIEILKAVTNSPDQYGRNPTTKQKVKNITYSAKSLIPAGVQLDKFVSGGIIKKQSKKDIKSSNPFNSF